MRRGLVLGCGGTVGSAWQVGALAAIEAAWQWDPRTAAVIVGTSGGASLGAMLGAGVGVEEMVAGQSGEADARASVRHFFTKPPAPLPALPIGLPLGRLAMQGLRRRRRLMALAGLAPPGRTRPDFLDRLTKDLSVTHPAVWQVAVEVRSGERVAFGAPGAPPASLSAAVRASWAVPGWYPPVTIGGRCYLDGGVSSTASADLVRDLTLDEVLVVAPMASAAGVRIGGVGGRLESVMRKPMSRGLDREIALLEAAGTRVARLCPSAAELAEMGPNFMDPRRRLPAMRAALRHVPARLSEGARQ
ncbi:patatin-like phospholipase family protein [Fodinicola acaciae]|uniref:patatin-like phospholipase family protein n=1 Tax=Fodinicola acaciae TaxID=2681555 RepID=UPI0013D5E22B|nr:patatin-like phospholipase family protein [Fodinicola acaciae]